jgi:tetratricopeptide (TPR) repeat protein
MSVIFRSLQKLKVHAGEEYRPALPFKRQRQIVGLRQGRFANLGIVSLVLLIFLSGIGTAYGIYKIHSDTPKIPIADNATGRPATAIDPQRKPAVALVPQKVAAPPRRDSRYFPAAEKDNDRRDGAAIRAAATPIPPGSASGASSMGGDAAKKITATVAAHPPVTVKRQPSDGAGRVNDPPGQPTDRMKKTPQKMIARQNVNRSVEINRLVNEIRSCMATAGCRQIDPLFDRLQALKGVHNPYVLKLKGYWLLQQDQFESAAGLLQKVLIQDENDLEANVNMAIAEMRLNRRQQAKARLARLREVYPDNAKLAEVWQQLN